jgi:glutaredoxin-like protein
VLRGTSTGPSANGGGLFKYYGMPGGTEFPAFLESIVDISRGEMLLSRESLKELKKLREDVLVRVFVTPTCGYCPQMVRAVYQLSLANPKVRAEVIEVNEFPELADRYQVKAVPLTVIGDKVAIPGAMHPDALVEHVVRAGGAEMSDAPAAPGPTSAVKVEEATRAPVQRGEQRPSGLIIP